MMDGWSRIGFALGCDVVHIESSRTLFGMACLARRPRIARVLAVSNGPYWPSDRFRWPGPVGSGAIPQHVERPWLRQASSRGQNVAGGSEHLQAVLHAEAPA